MSAKVCGAKKRRSKERCQQPAGWGTDHPGIGACKLHGGSVESHRKAAKRTMARQAVETYGLPRAIDPYHALAEELFRTAGHVAWLESVVHDLDLDSLAGPVGAEGDSDELTHHARAEPSVWVRMYRDERKHLAEVAKTCVAVGIAERQVKIAEDAGRQFATVLRTLLIDFGVDPTTTKARKIIRQRLTETIGEQSEKWGYGNLLAGGASEEWIGSGGQSDESGFNMIEPPKLPEG